MSGFEGITADVRNLTWDQCQVLICALQLFEESATDTERHAFEGAIEGAREQLVGARGVIEMTAPVLSHRIDYRALAANNATASVLRCLANPYTEGEQ